jgi:hypothetical protein
MVVHCGVVRRRRRLLGCRHLCRGAEHVDLDILFLLFLLFLLLLLLLLRLR